MDQTKKERISACIMCFFLIIIGRSFDNITTRLIFVLVSSIIYNFVYELIEYIINKRWSFLYWLNLIKEEQDVKKKRNQIYTFLLRPVILPLITLIYFIAMYFISK